MQLKIGQSGRLLREDTLEPNLSSERKCHADISRMHHGRENNSSNGPWVGMYLKCWGHQGELCSQDGMIKGESGGDNELLDYAWLRGLWKDRSFYFGGKEEPLADLAKRRDMI